MRVDGILFDKDGTLFDFAATWEAWTHELVVRLGEGDEDRMQALAAAVGYDLASRQIDRASVLIAGTPSEIVAAILPLSNKAPAALEAMLNDAAAQVQQHQAVPLAPLLEGFRSKGLKLGVATNDAQAPARAHLEAAGISSYFSFVAGYDTGHGGKPGPGMCLGFAAATGLDPARVVMVGDSLHDLHAGRAAGMQVVAVLTGPATAPELAPHADAVLPDIGHLPAWLAS